MNILKKSLQLISMLSCGVLFLTTQVYAADELGKTLLARGEVTAASGSSSRSLRRLSPVFRQDVLRSGNNARAQFRMIDDAYINLQQNSVLRLEQYQLKKNTGEGSVVMELISGGLRTITGAIGKKNKKDYQLKTPVATIGIRGTMYEVEIVSEGMYVAAWEGQIWVRSYSGECDITLGEGQPHSYALVNNGGECQLLNAIPEPFQEGHSSDVTESTEVADIEIEPLLDNPRREVFTYAAILLGLENDVLANGQADRITQDSPLLQTDAGIFSVSGAAGGFDQGIGGYQLSWGRWANYNFQGDAEATPAPAPAPSGDTNGLIWSSFQASDPSVVMSRQGTVRYDNMVSSLVQSSMGAVTNTAVQMDVNFDSGLVANGVLSADVPGYSWAGVFDGEVQDGELTLEFVGGNLVDSATGAFTDANGEISGSFVGGNAQGITGGFSMSEASDTTNQIEGVFLVEQ